MSPPLAAMRMENCAGCNIFPERPGEAYYHFETDLSLRALESASLEGCSFCKILYDSCKGIPLLAEEVYPDGFIKVWCGKNYLRLKSPSQSSNWMELYLTPESPFTWLTRLRDLSEYALSKSCYGLLHQWISKCRNEHESCNPKRPSTYPCRLLDVGHTRGDPIRLVKVESDLPYIALSHCWGGASPSMTTTLNLTAREAGFPKSDLSKSFQQAVAFTQSIGIRHLWIDCLCIVQDDEKDWEKESAKMSSIYCGAFLVLGATRATSCDEGFLGPREKSWNIGVYTFWGISFEVHARKLLDHNVSLGSVEMELATTPLFERGWCFQERILASRMVHFTNREIIFQCRKSRECECGGYTPTRGIKQQENYYGPGVPAVNSSHISAHRTCGNNSNIPAGGDPAEIDTMRCFQSLLYDLYLYGKESSLQPLLKPIWYGELWGDMVSDYTVTKLTYSKDILPALSGVASLMRAFSPGRYIAGLWELDLHYQLAWTSTIDESYCYRPSSYTAPSFSWASRIGQVSFPYNITITRVSSIVDISSKPKGSNTFGQVSNGFLRLEGAMIIGTCGIREVYHDSRICFFRSQDENGNATFGESECAPDCGFIDESHGNIRFDTTEAETEMLGKELFCFDLYWETSGDYGDCNHICGILLETADEAATFRRVGLVQNIPTSWFEFTPKVCITII